MAMASSEGTVVFASVGRAHYAFDVFSLDLNNLKEEQLTDGASVNFNAQFIDDPITLELAKSGNLPFPPHKSDDPVNGKESSSPAVVFVSERTGTSSIYLTMPGSSRRVLGPIPNLDADHGYFYCDRPTISGDRVIFTSTKSDHRSVPLHKPLTAVFSACMRTGETLRLTPAGVADYSPALSPSKQWLMVASSGGKDWAAGEIHQLNTSLWISKAEDGTCRRLVVEAGGWPTFADESTVFFHKKSPEDDWWSIYKVNLPPKVEDLNRPLEAERVTAAGVHAFTPAASTTGNWLVVATRRPSIPYRHIELFNLETRSFTPITTDIHHDLHHFNPFISATSDSLIGYHRSRSRSPSSNPGSKTIIPLLDHVACPLENITLLRIDGAFPSMSPDGTLIAYNTDFEAEQSGVMVAKLDGSGRRRICTGLAFSTCWSFTKPGVVYTSVGHIFAEEKANVHIVSLTFDLDEFQKPSDSMLDAQMKVLTKPGTNNNAFPSSSPDGKHLVFRSGRSGHKNLYIMDAELGEEGEIRALTDGPWVDTMPSWSPDGNWIAFSSTRDDPKGGYNFSVYLVRPDGTGLHRILPPPTESSGPVRGRFNHVCFSPDSQTLLFTADIGGVSAESVSVANQFQPYGELFSCKLDGSELFRWTHNAYEDGTPCWGPVRIDPKNLSSEGQDLNSSFQDCLWLDTMTEKMKQAIQTSP